MSISRRRLLLTAGCKHFTAEDEVLRLQILVLSITRLFRAGIIMHTT